MSTNLPATAPRSDNPFSAYAESQQSTFIVGKLLKFTKGDYTAGERGTPIPTGTRFVMNMDSLLVGWVRWEDSKPQEQIMGRIVDGFQQPPRNALGDQDKELWELDADGNPRDPWQKGNYVLLKIEQDAGVDDERYMSNDDDSASLAGIYTFAASSVGGLQAVADVCKVYGQYYRQKPGHYPVIQLGVDSYQHRNRSFGRIKKPVFDVVDWAPVTVFPEALRPQRGAPAGVAHVAEPKQVAHNAAAPTVPHNPETGELLPPVSSKPEPAPRKQAKAAARQPVAGQPVADNRPPMTAAEAEKRTINSPQSVPFDADPPRAQNAGKGKPRF